MKIKVLVIYGGETTEHEVSIISALQAMSNLDESKYEVIPLYIAKDKTWYTGNMLKEIEFYKDLDNNIKFANRVVLLKKGKSFVLKKVDGLFNKEITNIDIVLPVVHGSGIEDGSLAGYLDTIGVPYIGSKVLGGAVGQDKVVMKQILQSAHLPIVDYTYFYDNEYLEDEDEILNNIKKLGYPVIVKPATLGSSIGITFVENDKSIKEAINEAIKYDNKIVVEKAVQNLIEVNASVIGNYEYQKVSPLEEVMGLDEILSFADKYLGNSKTKGSSKGMASTSRIIPARIDDKLTNEIKEASKKVFKLLNLSGVCRIDYLIDSKTKKYYVNEPNTCPGSLSFYLWKEDNLEYKDMLDEIITLGIKDYKNRLKKVKSFDSNILNGFSGSKGVKGLKK
ncbi:MAG: D-alanine--D-alanine ligase [Bacilli bacterium]|nr:D-alanine--D-alanine ligase [Bacilli bacterium]